MHNTLTTTLVADGRSDRALIPLIALLLDEHSKRPYRVHFAENLLVASLRLEDRAAAAVLSFPCDLLFVHRDSESLSFSSRADEISRSLALVAGLPPYVCVVPVRMTEAWLLVDEAAIRAAVGNPRGTTPLALPSPIKAESIDAKQTLFELLETASELGAQRRRRFVPEQFRHRVAELLSDVQLLRRLPSFRRFEETLVDCLSRLS